MSLAAAQTSSMVVDAKERASSLLTVSLSRSNATLNDRGSLAPGEAMVSLSACSQELSQRTEKLLSQRVHPRYLRNSFRALWGRPRWIFRVQSLERSGKDSYSYNGRPRREEHEQNERSMTRLRGEQ